MHPIELLSNVADNFIAEGHAVYGAPPGCNGPHADPETPYRNTAHWLVLLARLSLLTGSPKYRKAAGQVADFLVVEGSEFKHGTLPIMRKKEGKDKANGVIGAAWLIEGLYYGGTILERPELINYAIALGQWHSFDNKNKLWKTREPDGSLKGIDTTLNHQIWYAMALSLISDSSDEISHILRIFSSGLKRQLRLASKTKLINHLVRQDGLNKEQIVIKTLPFFTLIDSLFGDLNLGPLRRMRYISTMHQEKEIGYLIFTLLGLVRYLEARGEIKEHHNFLNTTFNIAISQKYLDQLSENRWGYPYNPPGFEFPLLAEKIRSNGDTQSIARYYYEKQVIDVYHTGLKICARHNPDPATMTARMYALSLCSMETLDALPKITLE